MSYIVIVVLIIYITIKEYLSYKERQELLDRIMSKDIQEFKGYQDPEENQLTDEEDTTIPILDAKEEILNGEN